MTRLLTAGVAAALALASFGASDAFTRPSAEALKALKATVGKPFTAGYAFLNGKYIKPPYKVERYGTVIRINGLQVTDPIVPWSEFAKTQAGVTSTKSEIPVPGAPAEGETSAAEPAPATEPAPAAEPAPAVEVDDTSLDDLFDDLPSAAGSGSGAAKPARRVPTPRKPVVTVTYSFEGPFVHNEKTRAYLAKINDIRTKIDRQLRSGGYCCFSSRYSTLSGDAGAAKRIVDKLPDIMKRYSDHDEFVAAVNRAGLVYLSTSLVDDLFRNRIDYLQLMARRKADQEKRQWDSMLEDGL